MSKILLILIVMSGVFITNTRSESPIDFSTSDNLKAVYDAGFRPWRSTPDSCTVTDKNISAILPGNVQFSLPAQIATFSVLVNDQLSSADFIGEVMSTDNAIAKIHEICSAIGLSDEGLDQAVPSFADRAKPTAWHTRGNAGPVSINVTLDRLDFIDHFAAKVYITLQWKRVGTPMKFLTSPIQPPPGYENESMAPPGIKPGQKGFPEHDMQYYKDLIAKKKAEEGNSPAAVSPPKTPTPVAPNTQAQPITKTSLPIWIYGIGVIILGLIVVLWYRSRPKQ